MTYRFHQIHVPPIHCTHKNVAEQDGHQVDTSLLTKDAPLLQEEGGEHEYDHRRYQAKHVAAPGAGMKHSASYLLVITVGYAVRHLVHK